MDLFELAAAVVGGFVLAACTGIRAFLPLFLLGVAGLLFGGDWQTSGSLVILLGVAVALELAADKIPAVDHALDVVGLVLKPLLGGFIAYVLQDASYTGGLISIPLPVTIAISLAGAAAAFAVHLIKAKLRLLSSALTVGVASPIISVIEDCAAFAVVVLCIVAPLLAGVVVLVLAIVVARLISRLRS
jgi:hypothetical protein